MDWDLVCGLWSVACGLWSVVCGLWPGLCSPRRSGPPEILVACEADKWAKRTRQQWRKAEVQ